MVRVLLSIALVVTGASFSAAQSAGGRGGTAAADAPADSRPTIGGFWSTNLSTAAVPPGIGDVTHRGWSGAGATIDIPLDARWSLDARIMWNRKGARLQPRSVDGFQEISAHYISSPLMLKVKAGVNTRPYVSGGIEVSRLLSATTRVRFGHMEAIEDSTADLEAWDLAAVIGAGLERQAGRGIVFGGVLYSHGLRNVFADTADVAWAKTRTLTALAGVRF